MRFLGWVPFVTLTAMLIPAEASAQKRPDTPFGAPVSAIFHQGGAPFQGELIAVDEDRIWILSAGALNAVEFGDLARVDVRRHGLTGSRFATWSLIAGGASATVLTAACASVTDGCWGVFVLTALAWSAFTAIAVPGVSRAAFLRISPPDSAALRPYARFPQGLPPDPSLLLEQPGISDGD